jgi:hypothetical protein
MTPFEQAQLAIYQEQVFRDEQERKLRSLVTILQGFAAIITIIGFIAMARKK